MIDVPSSTWFTASPDWHWLIVFYHFFAGLAGGCFFIAALLDLVGRPADRPLARLGYYLVIPSLVVCGVLLIVDLSRPERFWHLFVENHTWQPLFKYWSPMSIGSWAMPAFGVFAAAAFLGALAESGRLSVATARRLRSPGALGVGLTVTGALLGLYIAGYSGVLLAVTNRPIWSDTPLLGMLLLVSSVSISAALMALLAHGKRAQHSGVFALHRMDVWLIVLQAIVLIALVATLGAAARGWMNLWGLVLVLGVAGLGMAAPLAIRHRAHWFGTHNLAVAAVLVLVGGFLLRTVIVFSPEHIQP
jgi:formate-dependent nitrite reductase membrane component NrfD